MITVYPKGELHFQNKVYKCAIGKNGIKKKNLRVTVVLLAVRIHLAHYTTVQIE